MLFSNYFTTFRERLGNYKGLFTNNLLYLHYTIVIVWDKHFHIYTYVHLRLYLPSKQAKLNFKKKKKQDLTYKSNQIKPINLIRNLLRKKKCLV